MSSRKGGIKRGKQACDRESFFTLEEKRRAGTARSILDRTRTSEASEDPKAQLDRKG